jgi:hypothetical protein
VTPGVVVQLDYKPHRAKLIHLACAFKRGHNTPVGGTVTAATRDTAGPGLKDDSIARIFLNLIPTTKSGEKINEG